MRINFFYFKIITLFILSLTGSSKIFSQVKNVDSAFHEARALAFSSKHNESKALCKKILEKSPKYQDVQVLLGRVYFWNDQTDSAIFILSESIQLNPYEDAYIALSDILRWTDKPLEALKTSQDGLHFFSTSEELFVRKIKALNDLEKYSEAYALADSLVSNKAKTTELRQLTESIKVKMSKNIFTFSYDYDYFDKQFKDPWHLFSLGYGRQTKYLGRVTARVNIANRFKSTGSQLEMDAYPSLGKRMYAYINAGYSPDYIFPEYRSGISIYRNFPRSFEGELGLRILYFSKATILYVGSIGKYKGNFWFSFRPTFIASNNGNRFSQSYALITRYYLKTSNDYITLTIGSGLSPDDRTRETLLQNPDLKSMKMNLAFQKIFKGNNLFSASAGIIQSDYIQGTKYKGINITSGVMYQKMF